MCMCTRVPTPEVSVDCLPLYFLRQGLSLNLELTDWLDWLLIKL